MTDPKLFVTQPFLPPLEEYLPYLEEIWSSRVLTNNGPFHVQFEQSLADYLHVPEVNLVANGTLALVVALQALRITGEVITTPYSFVATSNALVWNKLKPVFVDIDPRTCNIDPALIEEAVTPETSAILAVHCYGNPCDTSAINTIADRYGLRVIYDAAHAFGVRVNGKSILGHGDLSVVSFHATKVFQTVEGGAIIPSQSALKERIDFLKNFGFADETTVTAPGINAKMSELTAALGLLQLRYVDWCLSKRRYVADRYVDALGHRDDILLLVPDRSVEWNASYFPVFLQNSDRARRDAVYEAMKALGVYGRRYFYPLISDFPTYRGLPSAEKSRLREARRLADSVICLPISPNMVDADIDRVISSLFISLR